MFRAAGCALFTRSVFGLRSLFLGVVLASLGLTALRYHTPQCLALTSITLVSTFATAVVLAVMSVGPRRAFWMGFAVVGMANLAALTNGISWLGIQPNNSLLEAFLGLIRPDRLVPNPEAVHAWPFYIIGNQLISALAGFIGGYACLFLYRQNQETP